MIVWGRDRQTGPLDHHNFGGQGGDFNPPTRFGPPYLVCQSDEPQVGWDKLAHQLASIFIFKKYVYVTCFYLKKTINHQRYYSMYM